MPRTLLARTTLALLLAALGATGCGKEKPEFADAAAQAQKKIEEKKALGDNAPKEIEGKRLNAFFPETIEGGKRTFTTEKTGYTEAKYQKDGAEVCTLTIADVIDNADSKEKFAKSTEKVGGYPVATFGKKQTMLLVKDRYQVKIISEGLAHEKRKEILGGLNLGGIAAL